MVLGHDACGAVDATIKSLKDNSTLPDICLRWSPPSHRR